MLCNRTGTPVLRPYLDLKGSLEAAGEEAAERPHDGGKGGESNAVDLEGVEPHRGLQRQEATNHSTSLNPRLVSFRADIGSRGGRLSLTHPVTDSRMPGRA